MSDIENYSSLVLHEKIKYLSDNDIIEEFKRLLSDKTNKYFRVDYFFEELREKKSVLIDLFLAEHLSSKKELSDLFFTSENKAVKYLILKNEHCYNVLQKHFLSEEEIMRLMGSDFSEAIMLNKGISENEIKLITSKANKASENDWKNGIISDIYYLILNKSENTFFEHDHYFGKGYVHYLWLYPK